MIDPLFQTLTALGLALLFATAALHKWRSGLRFEAQLAEYRLLPQALVPASARLLAIAEGAVALALLPSALRAPAGAAAATLFLLYGLAIAVNLTRGRTHIDCGCGDMPVLLSPWLLLRNGLLAGGAAMLALPVSARALGWSDLVLGAPALLAMLLTWIAVAQLLENGSALRAWSTAGHAAMDRLAAEAKP